MKRMVLFMAGVFLVFGLGLAESAVMITEIHADPAAGIVGDANNDGVRSSSNDEFIEIFNDGGSLVNLSGWSLYDGVSLRHLFPIGSSIEAFGYLAVFGGGSPDLPDINWQTASSGSLSLNNSGDTVRLVDDLNNVVDEVVYGTLASENQSIVLDSGVFVLHTQINDELLFSPGAPSQEVLLNTSAVPEPASLFAFGLSGLLAYRKRKMI